MLGLLLEYDEIISIWGPATGYWTYNSRISYWALPQPPLIDSDYLNGRVRRRQRAQRGKLGRS